MKKICSIFFISVFIFLAIPNAVLGADRQKAVMLKEQGNKAMVAGDDKKAVDLYIKSIKADPSYANSYNNIGMEKVTLVPKLLEDQNSQGSIANILAQLNSTMADINGITTSVEADMPGIAVLISGDAAPFLAVSPVGTVVTVLLKGLLAGLCAGARGQAKPTFPGT